MLNLRDLAEEARAVVLEARREAAAIVETAKATAAGIRNQAELDAQASDRADDEASAARGRELAELAGAVVSELSAAKEQAMAAMRRDVVKLALELAAKIVGEVAVSDISAARGNLEKVLALSGRSGEIILKVNPSQHRRLGEHYRELTEVLAAPGVVRMVPDESVGPGGVKMLSGSGEVDATIETQLANLARGLIGGGVLFTSPAGGTYAGGAPAGETTSHGA